MTLVHLNQHHCEFNASLEKAWRAGEISQQEYEALHYEEIVKPDREAFHAKVAAVAAAWLVPGPAPFYHRRAQDLLRRDWPVLADALDALTRTDPVIPYDKGW